MPLDLLFLPFMQRAILGGVIVAGLTSLVGIFAMLRKASFFGDAIAHASLTGVAIGLLLNINPFLSALVFSLLIAITLPFIEKNSNLHIDAILGFVLPFSMALGVILLSFIPGYTPELISFLFGNILTVSWSSLLFISLTAISALTLIIFFWSKLIATAFDPTYAKITGISVIAFTMLHNVLLTLAIVPSISIVGIVLAGALLIVPAATVRQYTATFKSLVIATPLLAITATIAGILISAIFNLPTGPSIVLLLGGVFLVTLALKKLIPSFAR